MINRVLFATCLFLLSNSGMAAGEEDDGASITPEGRRFFESKIRPVLAEYCYRCHSTEEKIRGGLVLNTRAGMGHGGDSGSAVVPGELGDETGRQVQRGQRPAPDGPTLLSQPGYL